MPGPAPIYQPKFSSDELGEAQGLVRKRQVAHGLVQRARLVLLLDEEPAMSNPEAGRRLGVHENTIRYWRKRWATDEFRLEDRPRSGRPPVFSPRAGRRHQGRRLRTARPA